MSMRRFALLFNVSRTTVKRKVEFLAQEARKNQKAWLESQEKPFEVVEFDDLETFEHTKCKPITVTLFVERKEGKILDYSVARIGAKGTLAAISRKKYGKRPNESFKKRDELFSRLTKYIDKEALIKSDQSPYYINPIKKYFPNCEHRSFKGKRGAVTGQGELKKTGFDHLFRINHSFAMCRDNLKRLTRRSWCTSKNLEALDDQIAMYVDFHNRFLKTKKKKKQSQSKNAA